MTQVNQKLQNDEAAIHQLIQAAPIAVIVVNDQGEILFANGKLEAIFGYASGELEGQLIEMLVPAAMHKKHIGYRQHYTANPHMRAMGIGLDLMGQHKSGTVFPIEVGLGYLPLGDKLAVMASVLDISPRKQTEAFLEARVRERTQELERRRQVADSLREILALINTNASLDDILNQIVAQAIQLLGADAGAIYQLREKDGILQLQQSRMDDAPEITLRHVNVQADTPMSRAVRTRQPTTMTNEPNLTTMLHTGLRQEELPLWEEGFQAMLSAPLVVKDEVYGSLVLYYRQRHNFSEEALSLISTFCDQAALAVENARLYAQIEYAAVAAERSRIAHDLHDSVTQTLFSASIIADVLPRLWQRNRAEADRRVQELRELTRGALAEMRTLLLELRPTALTTVSLSDLLHQLADAVVGRARLPVEVKIQGEEDLPVAVRIALYRIAQEALNNVAKHAEAKQASVLLALQSGGVDLYIQDDGRGFQMTGISGKCLGLNIMRERAEEIGAQFTIHSQPDQGTVVHTSWQRVE